MEPYILVKGGRWSSTWECLASTRCHTAMLTSKTDDRKGRRWERDEKQRKRGMLIRP